MWVIIFFIGTIFKPQIINSKNLVHQPYEKITYIFLDPGHGGYDVGASCYSVLEKDLTLLSAIELKNLLLLRMPQKKILLTRTKDIYISLEDRCKFANKFLENKKNETGIFISLHLNSWFSPQTRGMELFYPKYKKSNQIQKIKNSLKNFYKQNENIPTIKKILSVLEYQRYDQNSFFLSKFLEIGAKNGNLLFRGTKPELFYVLKSTKMISVLIELGFISNYKDVEILMKNSLRKRVLLLLSNSIYDFIECIQGVGSSLSGIITID